MKAIRLTVTAAVAGIALGACAELSETIDRIARVLSPAEEIAAVADSAARQDPPEVEAKEIAALAEFSTAAGPDDTLHPAAAYIENLGHEVIAAIGDRSMKEEERIKFFEALLARDLDIPVIARFTLGRHWRKASKVQRRDYVTVFTSFVVQTYSRRLGGVQVDNIEIVKTQQVGKKDIVVRSRVARSNAKPVRADWRMRQRDGRFRILDLSVEGVSMALMLRQEFASVVRTGGGVAGLISTLKKRVT